jgi:hypothetical protein
MRTEAIVTTIRTHGLQSARFPQPYFVQVLLNTVDYSPGVYLPAVMDDFGNLVVVGGPL